jgi:Fic family protein
VGVIETAKGGVKTFDDILKLKAQSENDIQKLGSRSSNLQKIFNYLLKKPIIDVNIIVQITSVSQRTAYHIIEDLEKIGILEEVTGGKRGKVYVFKKYLSLFN